MSHKKSFPPPPGRESEEVISDTDLKKMKFEVNLVAVPFHRAACIVGLADLFVGSVWFICVLRQLFLEEVLLPMFGQYLPNEDGYHFRPPPGKEEMYSQRNLVEDPYRHQYLIVGMLIYSAAMTFFSVFLLLGATFKSGWMTKVWILPNIAYLSIHTLGAFILSFTLWGAAYALVGVPLLIIRGMQLWMVLAFQQTLSELEDMKKKWRKSNKLLETLVRKGVSASAQHKNGVQRNPSRSQAPPPPPKASETLAQHLCPDPSLVMKPDYADEDDWDSEVPSRSRTQERESTPATGGYWVTPPSDSEAPPAFDAPIPMIRVSCRRESDLQRYRRACYNTVVLQQALYAEDDEDEDETQVFKAESNQTIRIRTMYPRPNVRRTMNGNWVGVIQEWNQGYPYPPHESWFQEPNLDQDQDDRDDQDQEPVVGWNVAEPEANERAAWVRDQSDNSDDENEMYYDCTGNINAV